MNTQKFIYLFGAKTVGHLDPSDIKRWFQEDTSETTVSDIQNNVRQLAFCTREKEKEEYHLSKLPEITEQTSSDAEEVRSADKISDYICRITEMHNNIVALLPRMRTVQEFSARRNVSGHFLSVAERGLRVYQEAVEHAIRYRVLEQVGMLHIESCDKLIVQYEKQHLPLRVQELEITKENLTHEYQGKVTQVKTSACKLFLTFLNIIHSSTEMRSMVSSHIGSVRAPMARLRGGKIVMPEVEYGTRRRAIDKCWKTVSVACGNPRTMPVVCVSESIVQAKAVLDNTSNQDKPLNVIKVDVNCTISTGSDVGIRRRGKKKY